MDPRQTVRDGYDAIAPAYAAARSEGGRGAELTAALTATLPDDARVLDAGCGSGGPATVTLDRELDVVGLDLSGRQLSLLGDHLPSVVPVQGDLTALSFADGVFDGLVSSHAIIHIPRELHADVLAEFARVLRSGGDALLVLGSDPWQGRNPDWLETGAEMFWSFFGRERNLELVADAGFAIEHEELVDDELGGEFLFVRVSH